MVSGFGLHVEGGLAEIRQGDLGIPGLRSWEGGAGGAAAPPAPEAPAERADREGLPASGQLRVKVVGISSATRSKSSSLLYPRVITSTLGEGSAASFVERSNSPGGERCACATGRGRRSGQSAEPAAHRRSRWWPSANPSTILNPGHRGGRETAPPHDWVCRTSGNGARRDATGKPHGLMTPLTDPEPMGPEWLLTTAIPSGNDHRTRSLWPFALTWIRRMVDSSRPDLGVAWTTRAAQALPGRRGSWKGPREPGGRRSGGEPEEAPGQAAGWDQHCWGSAADQAAQ